MNTSNDRPNIEFQKSVELSFQKQKETRGGPRKSMRKGIDKETMEKKKKRRWRKMVCEKKEKIEFRNRKTSVNVINRSLTGS